MIQQFSKDNGKNAVLSIQAIQEFPTPPFKGPAKKAMNNGEILFSKMFNGVLTATRESIVIDNSIEKHKPKFSLGYEIELDYVIIITLTNGGYTMSYFDKETKIVTNIPFEGFLYMGAQ